MERPIPYRESKSQNRTINHSDALDVMYEQWKAITEGKAENKAQSIGPLMAKVSDPILLQNGHHSAFYPLIVGPCGRLQKCTTNKPDIILSFHNASQTISYLCAYDKSRPEAFEVAIETLYAIQSTDSMTINEFVAEMAITFQKAIARRKTVDGVSCFIEPK